MEILPRDEITVEEPKKTWLGTPPKACQNCFRPITDEFIDGKLKRGSWWAILCSNCHKHFGVGFGLGKGQKYKLIAWEGEEVWLKVEG